MASEGSDLLRFHVDTALLSELGERLVGRRSIALAELIKNAYDADATEVIVQLDNVKQPGGTITIEDNGQGMTFEVIKERWMRIATRNKVENPVSPRYGRIRTGAKGVGRFAAQGLSDALTLKSVARLDENTWEEVVVKLDWRKYTPGMDLSDINPAYTCHRTSGALQTGVTLVLAGAKGPWTAEDLAEVRKDIIELTPPFPVASQEGRRRGDPGFTILIVAPEFPEYEGELSERFLSAARYRLTGEVGAEGRLSYVLKERDSEVESTIELTEVRFPDLRGATCIIHHFLYSSDHMLGAEFGVRKAQRLGRVFGGVRLYLDGFRVFPYGDRGDDWLRLDYDRARRVTSVEGPLRQFLGADYHARGMLQLPGNNQLFGAVYISRLEHPNLISTLSREGLIDNDAFRNLRSFVRLGINWMTLQSQRAEAPASATHEKPRPSASQVATRTVFSVRKKLATFASPVETAEIVQELEELSASVRAEEEEHISKIAMLRVLASTGTMVVVFSHEIQGIVDGLAAFVKDYDAKKLGPLFEDPSIDSMETLRSWLRVVESQTRLLGLLSSQEARCSRRRLVVRPAVEDILATLGSYCRTHGIEVVDRVPAGIRTPPMYMSELYSVILNLLTNALKAVKDQAVRKIEITASETAGHFRLAVLDTGYGVEKGDRERMFKPFQSRSPTDPILGVGTGLGLTIVLDIAREHSGSAQFEDIGPPWSTCVTVRLPRGVDE